MTKTVSIFNQGSMSVIFGSALLAAAFAFPALADAALLTRHLDRGMTNSDVTSLQVFLSADSSIYPQGIVSGYYGPLTASAVSRFQTANNLPAVGRVGPRTLAAINAQMGGGASSGSDISAPIIYPEVVSSTANSATISWTTGEAANSRVMYGTSWPFLYSAAPSVGANSFGSAPNVVLNGLQPNRTYYYVLESVDGSGNVMWTLGKPVATK